MAAAKAKIEKGNEKGDVLKSRNELVGLPVVYEASGTVAGTVKDVVCQPGERKVSGLVVEKKGLMKKTTYVPWSKVNLMGNNCVMVDPDGLMKMPKDAWVFEGPFQQTPKVYDTEGKELGHVTDIAMDEQTGHTVRLTISRSILDDYREGRPQYEQFVFQGESGNVIVPQIHQERE